jgi:type IV pilus assembly protein PilC
MAAKKAQMMPTFAYEGVDRKGAKIKGNYQHAIWP